MFSDHKQFT